MFQIFDGHDGIEVIVDDLLVWGETTERLKRVLEIARSSGIKLNKDKCEIRLQEVMYIGHTLSSNGLKPDVNKVEAIRRIDTANDKAAACSAVSWNGNLPCQVYSKFFTVSIPLASVT